MSGFQEDRALVIRALAAYHNMSVPEFEQMIGIFAREREKTEWAVRAYHEGKLLKEQQREWVEEELRDLKGRGQG